MSNTHQASEGLREDIDVFFAADSPTLLDAKSLLRRVLLDAEAHGIAHTELRAERDTVRNEITDLNAGAIILEAAITQLRLEVTDLRTINVTLARAAAPANGRQEKIPDPPKYSGDRSTLRPFVAQLRLKLLGNADKFPDAQHALMYTIGRLEGIALEQILPFVTATSVELADTNTLITILESAFGDPDRLATAEREMDHLKQNNRDFSSYYADFQRIVASLEWNDSAKRHALRRGLSNELKDALTIIDIPAGFHAFVTLLQRLDNSIRARQQEQRSTRSSTTTRSNVTQPAARPTAAPTAHATNTNSGNYGPAAMDLSANRRKLTDAEKAQRHAEGRCLYCGGIGHFARLCPLKPTNRGPPVHISEAYLTAPANPGNE